MVEIDRGGSSHVEGMVRLTYMVPPPVLRTRAFVAQRSRKVRVLVADVALLQPAHRKSRCVVLCDVNHLFVLISNLLPGLTKR